MADSRWGKYNPVLPLDVLILKDLPRAGAMIMGVYADAFSVGDISKRIADGQVPSSMLSTRLRILHQYGLATTVKVPRSPTAGWQITPLGDQFVNEWLALNETPAQGQEVTDGSSTDT